MTIKSKHTLLAILCCIATYNIAYAGSFNVYPTKLTLVAGAKIGSLTVVNDNDTQANMQVRARDWTQDENGTGSMLPSDKLTVFPKIFKVPPHGKKVVRVGYQGKILPKELAFRVYIRELPVDEPGKMGMKMAVQISIPVFLRPANASQEPSPQLNGISVRNGKLVAWVKNPGIRYLMAKKIDVTGSKAGKQTYSGTANGWYVLAGVNKAFTLKLSRKDCMAADTLNINAVSEQGHQEKSFALNPSWCKAMIEKKPARSEDTSGSAVSSVSAK